MSQDYPTTYEVPPIATKCLEKITPIFIQNHESSVVIHKHQTGQTDGRLIRSTIVRTHVSKA